jgi:hypothetical protein
VINMRGTRAVPRSPAVTVSAPLRSEIESEKINTD